ncbi:MAG: NUDIX domain-containing protein [Gammaproteobacteria bacterium]|nr:NUDIX domain-containing protein [Gammaproteobacteria bacterium]
MIRVVCGVLTHEDRILVARRASGRDAGLWEFPGGKVDRGETPTAALVRELREELALECRVGEAVATARDSRIALTAYWIDTWAGVPPGHRPRCNSMGYPCGTLPPRHAGGGSAPHRGSYK